jgi:hypothetical protein
MAVRKRKLIITKRKENLKKNQMKKSCKGLPGCQENNPNIFTKAKNLVKDTAKHIAGGAQNLNDKEYLSRINTCKSCEYFVENKNTCSYCGCYMPVKARWRTSTCPKDKWDL